MRNSLFVIIICCLAFPAKSQDASVENSVSGLQTGFLGIWYHAEKRLSDSFVMRGELGLDTGIWAGSLYDETGFLLTPVITLEPRWYYNLKKREEKSKRIDGNSANFLSLKMSHHPDWFIISNSSNVRVISDISVIPTWGIRRSLGRIFNYETGIGFGYRYLFAKQAGFRENESDFAVNLHLRIGTRF